MNNINTNHEISLQQAIDMTTRYRSNHPANFPQYETFNIEAVKRLIANAECKYLRIYYGMKEDSEVDAILVAADEQEQDLLPAPNASDLNASTVNNLIIEDGFRCPQFCPSSSPLAGS